ncbi:MAG: sigma-E processing peptidase SpoIIGA [Acutalibacteraceae bacterium]|jgi:stage II sporulation protein GA (sporulation sigma-E factor processing peptidase)
MKVTTKRKEPIAMPVIYVDVLLAVNLLIDFLLLSGTAYLLRIPRKRRRLVLAAAVGAASALAVFLPAMPWALSLAYKLGVAALMTVIAYPSPGVRAFFRQLAAFFLVSVGFAGAAFALWSVAAPRGLSVINGVVYYDVPPLLLVAFSVISYLLLRLFDRITRKKASRGRLYRLQIDGGAGVAEINALCDTGLQLTEGFSGAPVAVVRMDAVEECLPFNLRQSLQAVLRGKEDELSSHAALRSRLRLIPYHTVDGEGYLPAFQPVRVTLIAPGERADVSGAFVAVTRRMKSREYEALIGVDLTDRLKGDAYRETQAAIR